MINGYILETTRSMSEPCERDFGSVQDSLIQRTMSDGVTSLKAPASHSRDEKATRSNQALPGKLLLIYSMHYSLAS